MNMAILTERARAEEKKENKRKFMENKAQQQERSQRQRSFGHPVSRFQAPMQYGTQSQATSSQGPRTQFKPYNNQNAMKPPQSNTSQVTANNKGFVSTAARPDTSLPTAHTPRSQQLPPTPTQ
jgi:hypothetical protein